MGILTIISNRMKVALILSIVVALGSSFTVSNRGGSDLDYDYNDYSGDFFGSDFSGSGEMKFGSDDFFGSDFSGSGEMRFGSDFSGSDDFSGDFFGSDFSGSGEMRFGSDDFFGS